MPYQMQVDGIEEISETLSKLEERAPAIAAKGLYEGAGVMADAMNTAAAGIKTAPFKWASMRRGETRLPSPEEKAIVQQAAAGIAKFNGSGAEIDTSIGFRNAGYAELKGKTVPIPKIVNAINSGTSFMRKQAFVRQAKRNGENKASEAMKTAIEAEFEALTK